MVLMRPKYCVFLNTWISPKFSHIFGLWLCLQLACRSYGLCPSPDWQEWSGSCYLLSDISLTFTDAEVKCEELGGGLVSVHSIEENNFLRDLCLNHPSMSCNSDWETWLGLQRSEPCPGCKLNERRQHWTWVHSRMSPTWVNWLDRLIGYSEPTRDETCARMWVDDGKWGSKTCDTALHFFCKTDYITTTQPPTTVRTTSWLTDATTASEITAGRLPVVDNKDEDGGLSTGTLVGAIIGCVVFIALVVLVLLFGKKLRKLWYKQTLEEGVYCNAMEMTDAGVYVNKKPDLPDVCAHYDDEALNLYETIPLENDAKKPEASPKKEECVDEDEYCVPRCSHHNGTHDHNGRCCNEYVESGNRC